MATYYVRPDGNNSNAGTGPASNQAWQTLARIVQSGTAFTSGDTVYIAPGTYRQSITTTATYTSATYFTGDPTASQFPGVTPGVVRITNFLSTDNSSATSQLLWGGVTFDYINISNIYFDHTSVNGGIYYTGTSNNSSIRNCVFSGNQAAGGGLGTPAIRLVSVKNLLIENCIVMRSYVGIYMTTTTDTDTNIDVRNSYFTNIGSVGIFIANSTGGGINVTNNLIMAPNGSAVQISGVGNATATSYVTNNIFYGCAGSVSGGSSTNIVENYNRRVGSGGNTTVATGVNTVTDGAPQFDFGHSALFNIALQKPFSAFTGSVNSGAGLATYASTSDLYGQTWSGGAGVPDIGCATAVQASGTSYYYPTDRNASTITIAPGSTSQSIELYLGATGLTASTSGLSARYNRTRTASVSIPLVARTIAQAWTSGGFAEVDATNMPGVYRLDLPDAALAAGADDVTVVVRGASGTNGAVMTVKLSSGGLTSAQTASAVWGADPSPYATVTTFGGILNEDHQLAVSTDATVNQIPNLVWDELRSSHTTVGSFGEYVNTNINTGAIADAVWDEPRSGHTAVGTFGQYVNAELVTPVSQASLVRMGPFQVIADGVTTPMPLDIQKGAQHGVDIQCVDNNLNGVDITGATVTAKVYDSGGALVDTYSCTATYAADGRATFTIDTTVTDTPGTYTATITRTTGASDTQIFGPLRIYVRDI